jgi:hypothetical protein
MDAYTNGIIIKFHDGIEGLVFPQFFTYSADYPEKYDSHFLLGYVHLNDLTFRVLLACIKQLGSMLCPRCLVPKDQIHDIGMKVEISRRDRLAQVDDDRRKQKVELARCLIYEHGKRPKSKAVANILNSKSLTPTRVCPPRFLELVY